MSSEQIPSENVVVQAVAGGDVVPPVKFGRNIAFQTELRRRVDAYFRNTGKRPRDCAAMYVKTGVLVTVFAATYALLVFWSSTWWEALPLAVVMGLATAGIGFNVQHDGSHSAYSKYRWINKAMALTLELIGGSSYLWHYRHVIYHHTYVNITGEDVDIDLGFMARLTPYQRRYFFQRWQHFYVWLLYGLMVINWHLHGDFKEVISGRMSGHKIPRPRGWDLVVFVLGKMAFFMLAFGVPLMFHPIWVVALFYAIAALVLGIVLSVVFQLAHAVEDAEFPMPKAGTTEMEHAWAVHQAETTVDFARRSRVLAWLLGGLNFQIEHHLLPKVCHVHFPALSKIVEETCREFGVKYSQHRTVWAGVASHFRWLREMGQPVS